MEGEGDAGRGIGRKADNGIDRLRDIDKGKESKNAQNFADVLCEWPPKSNASAMKTAALNQGRRRQRRQ